MRINFPCSVPQVSVLLALAIGIVSALPFTQFNSAWILEPDVQLPAIKLYYDAMVTGGWLNLPPPNVGSYFEGHCIIYAGAAHLYDALQRLLGHAPSFDQAALVSIRLVNQLAHVLATLVFFATVRRLSARAWVQLTLTALFALSPQILGMDLERIDHLMILLLVAVLHFSITITQGEARWPQGVALGLALGVLSATKMSGALFGEFPLSAALLVMVMSRDHALRIRIGKTFGVAMLTAIAVFIPLMIRYASVAHHFIDFLEASYADQMRWTILFKFTPRFYYNIDLFAGYGPVFLAVAGLSAAVVAVHALTRRDLTSTWVIGNLLLYSALGVIAFKYERGGYHLVPLYLYTVAIAIDVGSAYVEDRAPARNTRRALRIATAAAFAVILTTTAIGFVATAKAALGQPKAIRRTRIEPRAWLAKHIPPGTRVCIIVGSEWSNPNLDGLGYEVTDRPFDFPYMDKVQMAQFAAPTVAQIRASCDALVLDDFHKGAYLPNFRNLGADKLAADWEHLFETLARLYPPKVFAAKTPAYYVSHVEIYDLRNAPLAEQTGDADRFSRGAAISAVVENDEMRFGASTLPISADRFDGRIEAARYSDDGWLSVTGWAMDKSRHVPASAVFVLADSRIVSVEGTSTARRLDLPGALGEPASMLAGYVACAFAPGLPEGFSVSVLALSPDGALGWTAPPSGIVAQRTGPGRPAICP